MRGEGIQFPVAVALMVASLAGCGVGTVDGSDTSEASGSSSAPAPVSAFRLSGDAPKLLPFSVRLKKVADAVGIETNDPSLEALRAAHLELGDYDYAQDLPPDFQWSSSRMAKWVRVLLPVCRSEAFRSRYPSLPDGIESLVEAAYGRAATTDDLADIQQAVDEAAVLEPGDRSDVACVIVLSSAEMVLQ